METAIIASHNASHTPKFEMTSENKTISRAEKRRLENEHAIELMEEGIRSGRIKYKDVLNALGNKHSKRPVFVVDREDFEDAMLLQLMEDRRDEESVSLEEVLAVLRS